MVKEYLPDIDKWIDNGVEAVNCEGCGEAGIDLILLESGCHAHDYCLGSFYPDLLEQYEVRQATVDDLLAALTGVTELLDTWRGWLPEGIFARERFEELPEVAKARIAIAKAAPLDGLSTAIEEVGP